MTVTLSSQSFADVSNGPLLPLQLYSTWPAPGPGALPRDIFLQYLAGQSIDTNALNALTPGRYTTMPMIGGVATGTGAAPQLVPSSNDYYGIQWHFDYLGDIQTIWDEYSGAGVHVGVYDDGLQYTHPDLAPNYDASLELTVQGVHIDPLESTILYWSPHGTAVAGLIAAAHNDIGTVGVAWGASLTGVNIFSGQADINRNYAGFLEAADFSGTFDITNHSWGKFPGFWQDGVSIAGDQSLIDRWLTSLEVGRGGLGTINVKAAGNNDQNSNGDFSNTSRAAITVGAYDDDGDASYYSSYGANLLVSAPTSGVVDFFLGAINKGLVTTDLTETIDAGGPLPLGYNGLPDDDYTNAFGGTSGATPIVAGVVALMLDANEHLGWRDVQNILAYSAHEIGSGVGGVKRLDENNDWTYNGANNWNGGGLHYSEDYGYGSVNAYNAVRMAEVWNLFGGPKTSANENSFKQSTTQSVELLDGKVTDINFSFGGPEFTVDFVDVTLDISHTKLDDLEISLISPDGTVTSLVDFRFELLITNPDLEQATLSFGAQGFRGENGAGDWTIRIVDRWLEDAGTVNSASITLHGTDSAGGASNPADDVYHYTNEVLTSIAREGERYILNDTDGGVDWLNLSALSGNLKLRMAEGYSSTVGGIGFLNMASTIENAVAGDGNDDIIGTRFDNVIYGMRGNDVIFGADGDDTLSGGAGNDTLMGGVGSDKFLFGRALDAATNIDVIQDFNLYDQTLYGTDKIWLESSVFTGLALGALSADAFALGTSALDNTDRIIYDALTGRLYFDADGSGVGAAIQFAKFDNFSTVNVGPYAVLSFNDFEVVDTSNSLVVGTGADRMQPDAPTTSTSVDTPNLFGNGTPIIGTQYDDEILGKSSDDTISGLGGNDLLAGGAGNDVIDGGAGYDRIFGQDGDDVLRGDASPTSTSSPNRDDLYGGAGNDVLHGSAQQNYIYEIDINPFAPGDWLLGGDGDDVLFGYDGNDRIAGEAGDDQLYGGAGSDALAGGEGNDTLVGGDGSDSLNGGFGNDVFYAGKGVANSIISGDYIDKSAPQSSIVGYDIVYFEGKFAYYAMTASGKFNPGGVTFVNKTSGPNLEDQERTGIELEGIEKLVFSDREIDLVARPLALFGGDLVSSNNYVNSGKPVSLTANGYESAAIVQGAGDVTISDIAAVDELDYLRLFEVNGTSVINSDVLETLDVSNVTGSVTVNAQAGERHLDLDTYGLRLDAEEKLSDNTATSVSMSFATNAILGGIPATPSIASAGVNGANLSFQSARSINVSHNEETVVVRWDVRNAMTIDFEAQSRIVHEVTGDFLDAFGAGNLGHINILTPLDDAVLGTAGGSAEFRYSGMDLQGEDFVRFGNLGAVNAGNDGTAGPEAGINAGLGLRGTIHLGGGRDEVRILGSDAFQGGIVDGGFVDPAYGFPEADVIRMTFGVAEAIGDISGSISNFEILHLTATDQSHTADVTHFDALSQIVISSTSNTDRTNTVTNIADGSKVTFKTTGDFDQLSNNLASVTLEMAGFGSADTLSLHFQGSEVDGADVGSIVVRGAETLRISSDSLEYRLGETDDLGLPVPLGPEADPFTGVALDLQDVTSVYVSGETGWDFTIPGTSIANVTLIDGSAITNSGTLSGITARAPTANAVTFIGGAGNDVFEGGDGDDTLQGGSGDDVYVLNAGSISDTLVELADGGFDTIRSGFSDVNLNSYTNIENVELTGTGDLAATGTSAANRFTGNAGNNVFDGGVGADTVVFSGNLVDYSVVHNANGTVTVTDIRATASDGTDTLTSIEYLQFANGRHSVSPRAPTDIVLTNSSVTEAAFENILVGTLSATDAEGDTATFELLDDAGGRFKVVNGNEIRTVHHSLIDFEQQASHEIRVKVTDGDGLTFEKILTIDITNFDPEFIIALDTNDIIHGGDFNDYLNGRGGDDTLRGNGGSDQIIGWTGNDTAEFSGNIADYEITFSVNAFTVRDLRSNPDGTGFDGIDTVYYGYGGFKDNYFDASVEHLKFGDGILQTADLIAPSDISLSSLEIVETAGAGAVVGTLTAFDLTDTIPDGPITETFTYSLLDDAGGRFAIGGDKLVVAAGASLDFETAASHDVQIRVTDSDGHTFDKTFAIAVADVNEKASVLLTNLLSSVDETASTTTRLKVADIAISDPDTDGTKRNNTLSLVGRDAALFEIVGTALFLKAGVQLDYASKSSFEVAVAVDDADVAGNPDAVSATYRLAVNDVPDVKMIHGTSAGENLTGTRGADYFIGNGGEDTFSGGRGNDIYIVDSAGDRIIERRSQGLDTVESSVSHTLSSNVENLVLRGDGAINGTGNSENNTLNGNDAANVLSGAAGSDKIYGNGGADILIGGQGNDVLSGGAGDDILQGGSGSDRLTGGQGIDTLTGGSGRDQFIFSALSELGNSEETRDVITDFRSRDDKINLSELDAVAGTIVDDAFRFIGNADFGRVAGQLNYEAFNFAGTANDVTVISGDVDGDGIGDFQIELAGIHNLTTSDFIL